MMSNVSPRCIAAHPVQAGSFGMRRRRSLTTRVSRFAFCLPPMTECVSDTPACCWEKGGPYTCSQLPFSALSARPDVEGVGRAGSLS